MLAYYVDDVVVMGESKEEVISHQINIDSYKFK